MKDHLIYLASPYSHKSPEVMHRRFEMVCKVAGFMLNNGWHVYSPIAHTHPIACQCGLPKDFDFWKRYDTAVMSRCTHLIVVKLDGWMESVGVEAEIMMAAHFKTPIYYMDWPDYREWLIKNKDKIHG